MLSVIMMLGIIVNFEWDPPADGADGYIIAYGDQQGVYTSEVDVGPATSGQIDLDLDAGTKFVVAYAYNVGSDDSRFRSEPSNEVKVAGKPGAPTSLSFTLAGN